MTGLLSPLGWLGGFASTWLLAALICGSLMALVTWLLLRGPLRTLHPGWQALLWLVVIGKFLVPLGAIPATPGLALRVPAVSAAPRAPADGPAMMDVLFFFMPESGASAAPVAAQPQSPGSVPGAAAIPWAALAGLLWAAAVCVVLVRRIVAHARLRRRCAEMPLAPLEVRAAVHDVCRERGLRRLPTVRVSDAWPAPFIYGAWRPTLVLTTRHMRDATDLRAVVLHEIAHLRRGDLLVRYVQWLAAALFFFWPVVSWVNRRIDLARELSCDEWALRYGRFSVEAYARCLLRAVRPTGSHTPGLVPAAMAASVSHVERRIEVILHSKDTGRRARISAVTAMVLAGWCAVALCGAALQQAQTAEKVVVVRQVDGCGDATEVEVHAAPLGFGWQPAGGMVTTAVVTDGAPGLFMVSVDLPPAFLEAQRQKYPTADANGDGLLTKDEYHAYLVALAMSDPASVLARYPSADLNGDGLLSANEAARLVASPPMAQKIAGQPGQLRTLHLGGGPHTLVVAADGATAEAGGIVKLEPQVGVRVVKLHAVEGPVEFTENVEITSETGGDTTVEAKVIRIGGAADAMGDDFLPPPVWLLRNVASVPTAAEVAAYVDVAAQAPLEVLFERHPEADADGDGVLTPQEAEAFQAAQLATMHEKMLKLFPEADLDGDGVLSKEELVTHLRNQQRPIPWQFKIELKPTDASGRP